eukprot:495273_1
MALFFHDDPRIIAIIIILTLLSLFSIFIMYQLCYNLYCNPAVPAVPASSPRSVSRANSVPKFTRSRSHSTKGKGIEPFFKYTTISASFIFGIVCISVTVDRILSHQPYWSIVHSSIMIFILYFVGRIILSLNFIGRLHYTFLGSTYAKSQCTMRSLKFFWFLMPCFSVVSFVMYPVAPMVCYIVGSLVVLLDMILSIVLLVLYVKTLSALVNGNKANQNKKVITVMIRYTLLYTISFGSTLGWIVMATMSMVIGDSMDPWEVLRFLWVFTAFDAVFNSLSLWLNMQFATVWYFRLCSFGHNNFKRCFHYYNTEDVDMMTKSQSHLSQKSQSENTTTVKSKSITPDINVDDHRDDVSDTEVP